MHYGMDTVQVPVRLRAALTDLREHGLPTYRPLLGRWLDQVPDEIPREARP